MSSELLSLCLEPIRTNNQLAIVVTNIFNRYFSSLVITEAMLSATSSTFGTNANNHTEQSPSPLLSTTYSCTSCQISFQDGQEQRIHMKTPWQYVKNIMTMV